MVQTRRIVTVIDTATADGLGQPCTPVTRAVTMAVFANPFAGQHVEDLAALFEIGGALGADLSARTAVLLPGPVVSYGKASIVGVAGDMEHGGAAIHPKLGAPMRAAVGGGAALIPSNVKIGGPGTVIDIPLGHKDEAWSFDHFDTISVMVPDAPRPDEIVLAIAMADGGRPLPRCGSGTVRT